MFFLNRKKILLNQYSFLEHSLNRINMRLVEDLFLYESVFNLLKTRMVISLPIQKEAVV